MQHELAQALTPVGARDRALPEDLLDDEAQLGSLLRELLELEEDVPHHPVAPRHQLELVEPVGEVISQRHHECVDDERDVLEDRVVVHVLGDVPLELRRPLGAIVAEGEHALARVERQPYGPPRAPLSAVDPVRRRRSDERNELARVRRELASMRATAAAPQAIQGVESRETGRVHYPRRHPARSAKAAHIEADLIRLRRPLEVDHRPHGPAGGSVASSRRAFDAGSNTQATAQCTRDAVCVAALR